MGGRISNALMYFQLRKAYDIITFQSGSGFFVNCNQERKSILIDILSS
jgi:hypothetical protein